MYPELLSIGVIYNRSGVSKKTKEKVTRIMEELNYQPNILARRLASTQTIKNCNLASKNLKGNHLLGFPAQRNPSG